MFQGDRDTLSVAFGAVLFSLIYPIAPSRRVLIGGEVAETYDLMRRQREQRAILT